MIARFQLRSEKDPRIERLGLREVIFRDDESDIPAELRREAARSSVRMIAEFLNGATDSAARFFTDIRFIIEHEGNSGNGKGRSSSYILDGWPPLHGE
jgi:hypothetical protein